MPVERKVTYLLVPTSAGREALHIITNWRKLTKAITEFKIEFYYRVFKERIEFIMSRITLPAGIASFPALFEPVVGFEGTPPKYNVTILWDRDADMSGLKKAIDEAIAKKWPEGRPNNLKMPLKDGNTKLDKEGNVRPEFEGKKFAKASCNATDVPKIVDAQCQPIIDRSKVYGGAEMRVAVSVFAYDKGGNRGISLYLGNVQVTGEGQPFGNASTPESDFGF